MPVIFWVLNTFTLLTVVWIADVDPMDVTDAVEVGGGSVVTDVAVGTLTVVASSVSMQYGHGAPGRRKSWDQVGLLGHNILDNLT